MITARDSDIGRTTCFGSACVMRTIRGALVAIVHALLTASAAAVAIIPALSVSAIAQTGRQEAGEDVRGGAEQGRRVLLRFLTDADYPPFNFYDEDGILTGFNIDLARAICLELDVTCDISVRPWDKLLPALRTREADAVIAGHTVTALTIRQVDFSRRYFHTPGRFAVRRESAELKATPEGLDDVKVGVTAGTTHEAYLRAFFRSSRIRVYDNVNLAREALRTGKIDALFDDAIGLAFWLNGTSSQQCCMFNGGAFMEPKFFGDGMAIALPKGNAKLKSEIDGALQSVRDSGRFEELVSRYFPFRLY